MPKQEHRSTKKEAKTSESEQNWEIDRKAIKISTRKIISGKYGDIWEGKWQHKQVAVEIFKPGAMSSSEFQQGAEIMKQLSHSRVLTLFGVCTREGPVYIVTELMESGCLLDYLRDENVFLRLSQRINIGEQVANGMAYLESKCCIHRDLAARNIFIDENRICKVAGLHLAHILIGKDHFYEDSSGMRFPIKWTAPEALQERKFSIKSDVWSFGIVLYEIITCGSVPYPGMTNDEVLKKIKSGYKMPCPAFCYADYYDALMMSCWKEDPNKRPSFKSVQFILEDFFTDN